MMSRRAAELVLAISATLGRLAEFTDIYDCPVASFFQEEMEFEFPQKADQAAAKGM